MIGAGTIFILDNQNRYFFAADHERLKLLLNSVSLEISKLMLQGHAKGLGPLFDSVSLEPEVKSVRIFGFDGRIRKSIVREEVGRQIDPRLL